MEDLGLWVEGWGPERWEHKPRKGGGPEGWGPRREGGPKFRAFFPLPPQFSFFFSLSLWVTSRVFFPLSRGLLVEFWWCFGRSGLQMCLFSPSGCRVEAPGVSWAGCRWQGCPGQGGPGQGGVQGMCYRFQKRDLKNKIGLNNIWSRLKKKHLARGPKT